MENRKKTLQAKGYEVVICETKKEAKDYILKTYNDKTIGIASSITFQELGVFAELSRNNIVYSNMDNQDANTIKNAMCADVYMTSVNAITENGELINIDGRGNRVAGTIYGPQEVLYVIGKNKFEDTIEKAVCRTRNIAGPLNAKRLNLKTPCVSTGKCMDCKSPGRICNTLNIMLHKTYGIAKATIILVNEDLGY